jgi:ribosome-associated protein
MPMRRCPRIFAPSALVVTDADDLAGRALALVRESFIAASGPGGQNVNKVATAVQLRLDVYALRLPVPVFHRLKHLAGSRMTAMGELVLTARRFRTQEANREDARARLLALLAEAQELPTARAKSRLNRVGKTERLASKKRRGAVKAGRGRIAPE